MDFLSIRQKGIRFYNIVLTTLPHNYQKKKLKILEELFVKSNQYLMDNSVEFWLDFGTLLGHYREGRILPHDLDVDFGCLETEYKKLKNTKQKLPKGLSLVDSSYRHHGFKMYFNYKGFDADIYFYEDNQGMLTSGVRNELQNNWTPFSRNLALPIQKTKFLDQPTYVPNQVIKYLEHIYNYIGTNGYQDKKTGYWYEKS